MLVALILVLLASLALLLFGILAPPAQIYFKKEDRTSRRAMKVFGSTAAVALLLAMVIAPSPSATTAAVPSAPSAGIQAAVAAPVPAAGAEICATPRL